MTRLVGGLVFVLLTLAALLQVNDPDPLRWALFYGLGALVGLLAALSRLWWRHALGYALLGIGVGVALLISARADLAGPWIDSEPLREGVGALIAGGLGAVLAVMRRRDAPQQPNPYTR